MALITKTTSEGSGEPARLQARISLRFSDVHSMTLIVELEVTAFSTINVSIGQ